MTRSDRHIEVRLAVDAKAALGEGPSWDDQEGVLIWVDITPGLVHRFDPSSGTDQVIPVGQSVSVAVRRTQGGLVVATRRGFSILDTKTGRSECIAAFDPSRRKNDGKCDSQGRFWVGTIVNEDGPGGLYRLELDGSVTKALDGVGMSNGLCWSQDDETMFYIDTAEHRVDVFDHERQQGTITNRRPFTTIQPAEGDPDGMTIDEEGYIWVALWRGWAVHRYAPNGELDRVIRMPVSQVTSVCFGGPDLRDLYITTACEGDPGNGRGIAGGLYCVQPGVRGLPTQPYRG